MENVITQGKIPIKSWVSDLENGAVNQVINLANLPFAVKHVALMPDAHQGYGMPIGGVLATKGVVIPNAVGVDIGCGMIAVKTSLKELTEAQLVSIRRGITEEIPVGFNKRTIPFNDRGMPSNLNIPIDGVVPSEYDNAKLQMGTLGGGNHFIEIQKGSDGHIWIMIHSGSRNLGKKIADHYNKLAIELNEKYHSSITKDQQLAFLPLDTDAASDYMQEMFYAKTFASMNRFEMMRLVLIVTSYHIDKPVNVELLEDKCHNYVQIENHFGKNIMVHRKGAQAAWYGDVCIIPSSQGSKSYIGIGKGNVDSFKSCSHGAGRKMSRSQAIKTLNLEEETAKMSGILHGMNSQKQLDESPSAYKDIDKVMANQADLVSINVELTPLAVIKG